MNVLENASGIKVLITTNISELSPVSSHLVKTTYGRKVVFGSSDSFSFMPLLAMSQIPP
jgi:hypothetical protein